MKPTTEDIAKWALEVKAGLIKLFEEPTHTFNIDQLQNFAALAYAAGAAAERGECAKECDRIQDESLTTIFYGASNEYREGRAMGANLCGTAIRARGEKNDI